MIESYNDIKRLLADKRALKHISEGFAARHAKICNTNYKIMYVCIPEIKKAVKKVRLEKRDNIIAEFISDEEKSFESVIFVGCLAAQKDKSQSDGGYEKTREYLKNILPFFDSWAHVDTVVPCLKWVDADLFLRDFEYLSSSDKEYFIRTYIIFMLDNCLNEQYLDFVLDKIKRIKYGQYYVDMGAAWLIAEALVKQYDKTLPLILSKALPKFVHNKAIQKARESFRISDENKNYLNNLKIK